MPHRNDVPDRATTRFTYTHGSIRPWGEWFSVAGD